MGTNVLLRHPIPDQEHAMQATSSYFLYRDSLYTLEKAKILIDWKESSV